MEDPYQRPGRAGAAKPPVDPDPRRPEPAPAAGVHRRPLGGTSQGAQERTEVQGEAMQPGESGEDRDPGDQVAGGAGAGAADHRVAGDDRRRAVIGSARGLRPPGAPGHPRRCTRLSRAGPFWSGIAVSPPESGLTPPKRAKRSQRWGGCADYVGPADSCRAPVGPVTRPAWSPPESLMGSSSWLQAPRSPGLCGPARP